ncbi:MAG: hypothetical protein ACK5CH_07455 [Bacteroidota bacterium]
MKNNQYKSCQPPQSFQSGQSASGGCIWKGATDGRPRVGNIF